MTFKNIISLYLSVVSIIILVCLFVLDNNTEIYKLLNIYDFAICVYFMYEFLSVFKKSESKLKYLFKEGGWIDLLSAIPSIEFLRVGRFVKIFRLFRIFKSFKLLKSFITQKENKFSLFGLIYLFVFIIFPIIILIIEGGVDNSNIKTAEDALWWTYVSITTVGYGDFYPVTSLGKIIASILILFGVGLFGIVTSYFSNKFNIVKNI